LQSSFYHFFIFNLFQFQFSSFLNALGTAPGVLLLTGETRLGLFPRGVRLEINIPTSAVNHVEPAASPAALR
jgi:hypothetical protein